MLVRSRNEYVAMSQFEEVRRQGQRPDDGAVVEKHPSWGSLVILFAVACSLAWIYFWLWALVLGVRMALS
jgi:hypothetical protein